MLGDLGLTLAQAERERAYSPSSCIAGNYQPFIAAYAEQSLAARVRTLGLGARWLDVRYGAEAAQRMDLCLPAAQGSAGTGLLVFVHGGYWQELSARNSLFAAAHCVEHGLAFCALDYTLAPQASIAEIVAECRAAMQVLHAQAPQWGIDPARIVVAGSSAGAHLAAMTCLAPGWKPHAGVLLSGIFQLEPLVGTSINQALGLDVQEARAQSPLLQPVQGFPQTLLCWGQIETDAFKAQSQHFAHALQTAGTPCAMMEVATRNHFDLALDLADPRTTLGRHTLSLLGVT